MSNQAPTAEEFTGRLFESAIAAMDILSVSVGQQLGYYEALASGACTPGELARTTSTNERYTREWLEQQAVTGLLEYDATCRRFSMSEGLRESLLGFESLNYIGAIAPMVVSLAQTLPQIIDAFRTGGGVAWSAYGEGMVQGQGAFNRPMFVNRLCQEYFPQVEGLSEALSRPGARIADVGCGVGWSAVAMAKAYPAATVDGFDLDGPSLESGRRFAEERGVSDRLSFHESALIPRPSFPAVPGPLEPGTVGSYDLVAAFECIHDMSDPVDVLRSMREVVKPGGTVLVMDERVPDVFAGKGDEIERIMYGWSIFCCLPAGMADTPSAATGTVMRRPVLERYASEAGFKGVEVLPIEDDFFRFYRLVH